MGTGNDALSSSSTPHHLTGFQVRRKKTQTYRWELGHIRQDQMLIVPDKQA